MTPGIEVSGGHGEEMGGRRGRRTRIGRVRWDGGGCIMSQEEG